MILKKLSRAKCVCDAAPQGKCSARIDSGKWEEWRPFSRLPSITSLPSPHLRSSAEAYPENSRILPELLLFTRQSLSKKKCHFFIWQFLQSLELSWEVASNAQGTSVITHFIARWCQTSELCLGSTAVGRPTGVYLSLSVPPGRLPKCRQLSIILQKTTVNTINLITNFNSSIKDYLQMSAYQ